MRKNNSQVPLPATNNAQSIDLKARAHQEMVAGGLLPDFEPSVIQEIENLKQKQQYITDTNTAHRDLRSVLWSSIDNPESKDLDQIEYAEEQKGGNVRVMIAIADVD